MLEIAMQPATQGVFQKDIAEKQEISLKYLDHIIHDLKTARLIANVKGKKSGYVLTREPAQITIYDIFQAFEPGICIVDCLSDTGNCTRREGCSVRGFYGELNQMIIGYLKGITLQELVQKQELLDLAG